MSAKPKILLAHSYFLRRDPKQMEKMKPYPPLSTLIAANVLRGRGHSVALFDAMLADGLERFAETLDRVRPAIVGILEDNFNFLTKMCTLVTREATLAMVREARARGCRVAVNGADAVDRPEIYIDAGADAVIVGEAELAFADVVKRWLSGGESLDDVPGLALPAGLSGKDSGRLVVLGRPGSGPPDVRVRFTPRRVPETDLDALPFPAWDLVDVEAYRSAWIQAHGRFSWNMATSRGCPYGCNWCAKPVFGRRYAQRSPRDVAEEMRALKDGPAPDHVWFADDIWGLTPRWIEAFADEVRSLDAAIPFMVQSRVNLIVPETARALARAGAEEVWMGVESGSQAVLDAMDKGSTVEQARTATRALRENGIRACWFIQLGYPGEDWPEIVATRDLVRAERPDDIGVSVAYPLPGTKFYERVAAQLGTRRNWIHTDDLAMLFQGAYTTAFYRRIRTLLHREVDNGRPDPALDRAWAKLSREESRFRAAAATRVAG